MGKGEAASQDGFVLQTDDMIGPYQLEKCEYSPPSTPGSQAHPCTPLSAVTAGPGAGLWQFWNATWLSCSGSALRNSRGNGWLWAAAAGGHSPTATHRTVSPAEWTWTQDLAVHNTIPGFTKCCQLSKHQAHILTWSHRTNLTLWWFIKTREHICILVKKYWMDMTDPRGLSKEQFNIPFYSIWHTTEFIQLELTNGFEHSL